MQRVEKEHSIEVRYSWVICGAVSYISAIFAAWVTSGAILTDELKIMYASNPAVITQASFVASFSFAIYCFATLFGAVVMRHIGLRAVGSIAVLLVSYSLCISPHNPSIMWWTLTYGIQAGIGFGFMAICTATIQPLYFDRNHGLNYGIILFSSGIMTFGYPLIWIGLIKSISFVNTMYVFSGVFLTALVAVALLKPRNLETAEDVSERSHSHRVPYESMSERDQRHSDSASVNVVDVQELLVPDNESLIVVDQHEQTRRTHSSTSSQEPDTESRKERMKKLLRVQLFRNKSFLYFIFGTSLRIFGQGMFTLHIISFARLYYPHNPTKALLSIMGITQCFARLISAWLVDRLQLGTSLYILQLAQTLCAASIIFVTIIVQYSNSFVLVVMAMAVFGIWDGPAYAMQFPIMCRMVQRESIPIAVSFHLVVLGIFASVGPTLTGLVVDISKSYSLGMYLSTIPVLFGSLLMFLINLRRDTKIA